MPTIAEKEKIAVEKKIAVPRKFKELEAARDYLVSAIAADEDDPDSVIYNVQIIAISITTRLESMAKQLRKIAQENKEMAEMLDEMVSSEETAELVPSKKLVKSDVKEAAEAAVNQAVNEAKAIAKNALSDMKRYEMALTQYFVKIVGKYAYLLGELKKAAEMLNMKKKEIAELNAEYAEYYSLHNTVRSAVLGEDFTPGWAKILREKIRKIDELKNFEVLANGLQLFIASNKKYMEELGNLIKLQSDLRFKKAIELADMLIKEAAEIYAA